MFVGFLFQSWRRKIFHKPTTDKKSGILLGWQSGHTSFIRSLKMNLSINEGDRSFNQPKVLLAAPLIGPSHPRQESVAWLLSHICANPISENHTRWSLRIGKVFSSWAFDTIKNRANAIVSLSPPLMLAAPFFRQTGNTVYYYWLNGERKSGKRKKKATMGQSGNHKKEYIWTFGTLIRFDGLERVDPWMRF